MPPHHGVGVNTEAGHQHFLALTTPGGVLAVNGFFGSVLAI